jgi:archaeal type IV pilus assembly protein PilA
MHYLKRLTRKNGERAVSPVVGVMLMLVVTIIIAAVVSTFAGSTVNGGSKSPAASMEIHVKNGGTASNSYFSMKVLGVSEPISTKNLKVITSWQTTNKNTADTSSSPAGAYGAPLNGGSTSSGAKSAYVTNDLTGSNGPFSVPTGYGNGVMNWSNNSYHTPEAQWGNFVLSSGTSTFDAPVAYTNYGLGSATTTSTADPMQAILGNYWYNLRAGDTVSVRIIDLKSGKELVDQNVVVEGP